MMETLDDVRQAVDDGKEVRWANEGYRVYKDSIGQYLIEHTTGNIVGINPKMEADKFYLVE